MKVAEVAVSLDVRFSPFSTESAILRGAGCLKAIIKARAA
jgi:hypothetical protein